MKIDQLIGNAKTIGITSHVRPDGDAIGSSLGMYLYIKKNYPAVKVSVFLEKVLPVPPFYKDGNPQRATTWFKDNPQGNDIYKQMTFYRAMAAKYGLKLYRSECSELPGQVIYEDDFQIAVINTRADIQITTTEVYAKKYDFKYWPAHRHSGLFSSLACKQNKRRFCSCKKSL